MRRVKGVIELALLAWGAVGVVVLTLATAVYVQSARLTSVKKEYAMFTAGVMAVGEVAKKAKKTQETLDKQRKVRTDATNLKTTSDLRAQLERLHDTYSGPSGMPGASTPAPGSATTNFDPAGLAAALGRLAVGGLEIVGDGQKAIINLDAAKEWAANRSKE